MKMFRLFALLLVLALGAVFAPAALAQEETFGLTAEDFELFNQVNTDSAAFDTITYTFDFLLTISGMDSGGDLVIDVNGGGQIGTVDGAPLFSMLVEGALTGGGENIPADMEVRMVGDMLYLRLGEEWQGGPASELFNAMGGLTGGMLPVDPSALAEDPSAAMGDMMAVPGMMEAMMAFSSLDFAQYIDISRSDVNGNPHFTINIGIADLLASPEMGSALGAVAGGAMGGGAEMSEEQTQQMGMMMAMLFADLTLTYEQFVGSSKLIERGLLTLNFPLSAMLTGGAEGNINMVLDVGLSGVNQPISVEAPASFQPFDMGAMMGM
jgi:uncharacterized protein YfiM (DUF2279 family)